MDYSVSIIIPTWNREKKLSRAIASCVGQTYPINEIIIVDDGSTDNTKSLVADFQKKHKNIEYVFQENRGAQAARNLGWRRAKSSFIGFLDSDDEIYPNKIEKQINLFKKKPDLGIVSCYMKRIYPDSREMEYNWKTEGNIFIDLIRLKTYVDFNAPLIKRLCLEEIGGLDEKCPSSQEWDLHLCFSKNFDYGQVPEYLAKYYMAKDETNIYRSLNAEFEGFVYILSKHKKDLIKKVGYSTLFNHQRNLLFPCAMQSSKKKEALLKILQLDPRFFFFFFYPEFFKRIFLVTLEKLSIIKKNLELK